MSQSVRSNSAAAAAEASVCGATDITSLDGSVSQDTPLAGMVCSVLTRQ